MTKIEFERCTLFSDSHIASLRTHFCSHTAHHLIIPEDVFPSSSEYYRQEGKTRQIEFPFKGLGAFRYSLKYLLMIWSNLLSITCLTNFKELLYK